MKSRILLAAVAFLGYAIIDGPAANAQVYFDNNDDMGDGLWSTDTNWSATDCHSGADGVPGSGDHAIICADLTVTVDDTAAEAQKVTVRNGSMIDIRPANGADATLTLGDGNNQFFGGRKIGVPGRNEWNQRALSAASQGLKAGLDAAHQWPPERRAARTSRTRGVSLSPRPDRLMMTMSSFDRVGTSTRACAMACADPNAGMMPSFLER